MPRNGTLVPIKKIAAADETRVLFILHTPGVGYRFIEYSQKGGPGGRYWGPTHWSRSYPTADEAERAAGDVLPWTRARSSLRDDLT